MGSKTMSGFFDPRYVSPEFIQGGRIGPWSDVYQVGLLLFEMVTGRPPFVGRTPNETRTLQCNGPIPRMIQYREDVPQALQELVDRMMAKEPAQRILNATALLSCFRDIASIARVYEIFINFPCKCIAETG